MVPNVAAPDSPVRLQPAAEPLVCVVDEESDYRENLCRMFHAAHLPIRVFPSPAEFLADGCHTGPCCVVMDIRLSGMDGFQLQSALSGRAEQIVFLAGQADVPMCARAMKAGAVDFLTKSADKESILEAAERALARSREILRARQSRGLATARIATLTSREFAVMHRVIAGLLNKQIAAELGITEKTIKVHRGRVMQKTGVTSVADLVRLALLAGIPEIQKTRQ
ncbi:MAG: response regulator transcription factor [Verrucomicrobiaceae bacterium]|nr:MAG: response regulator transcription factor [Verrucomicrobiaceae bacterium]